MKHVRCAGAHSGGCEMIMGTWVNGQRCFCGIFPLSLWAIPFTVKYMFPLDLFLLPPCDKVILFSPEEIFPWLPFRNMFLYSSVSTYFFLFCFIDTDEDTVKRCFATFEEKFFQTCEKELAKINIFYSGKVLICVYLWKMQQHKKESEAPRLSE